MKPLSQMVGISDDLPVEEMIETARRHRHRRLPIYDETPDTIVGILNTRALLLNPQTDLSEAIEFPSFVPASMNLLQLLKSLQRQKRGLAVVLDEYGGTAGLITTEDILAEMVGELRNEGEAQGFVLERLGAGRWRANATMRLEDFRREHPAVGDPPEVETLGGLVVHHWGVVPAVGATCVLRDLKFTVTAADERRVREVLVETVDKRGGR
jgi:CBS domain containing-hemolysin-like protein